MNHSTLTALSAMIVPLLTPKIIGGTFGALTLAGIGYAVAKWGGSKQGLEFRKKIAASIRDKANKAIEKIEDATAKLETELEEEEIRQTATEVA